MAETAFAYVTLIPVAKGFQKAIASELGGAQGLGKSAGKSTGAGFTKGFAGPLKGLAIAAGGALAAVGVGKFFKDSISQASDLGESVNAVSVAYGEFSDDVLKLSDGVASRLGLSKVDFNGAAVRFSAFAGKIAGEGGDVAGVVDSLTSRAADFASVYNIEVSEALEVMQSGLSGSAEPFKRFGINLLDSEVKAYAYANGIGTVGTELTETEKVQARYGLILQETAKTAGDFANTQDGLANSQRILKASITDLQAGIGEGLAPVMATFTAALVPLVEFIFPKIAAIMNNHVAPALQKVADAFKSFTSGLGGGAEDAGSFFDGLSNKIRVFFAGDSFGSMATKFIEIRQKIIDTLVEMIPRVVNVLVDLLPAIVTALTTMIPAILKQAIDTFSALLEAVTQVLPVLMSAIVEILPKVLTALVGMIPKLLDSAIDLFMSLVDSVMIILPQLLKAIVDMLPGILKAVISLLPDLIKAGIELFNGLIKAVVKVLPELLKSILAMLPDIIDTVIDMLPDLIKAGFELFSGLIDGLLKALPEIIDAVIDMIPEITGALMDNIPKLIAAGMEIVKGLAKGIIDNAPRLLGQAISSLGSTLVNGVKDFLGIRSPSKVFIKIGEQVGDGFVSGIHQTMGAVEKAAKDMGDVTVKSMGKAIADLEVKFTTITNIPKLLANSISEAVEISMSDVRRMAEEVEGLFAKFDKNGKLSNSYSGFGVDNLVNTVGGGSLNLGKLTDTLNSLQKAGYNNVAEAAFGGSFQQALDTLMGQQSFTNAKTGMSTTVGGTVSDSMLADLAAQGFVALPKLDKSVADLTDAIDSLNSQVASKGLTPFASGGLVTGPTAALIGEAGPEVVIPLNRFESMMGMTGNKEGKSVNYYAAPNNSIDSEQALFQAMRRAKVVAGW